MYCQRVDWGTPLYDWSIDLRTRVLRDPLKLVFYKKDLREEYDQIHWLCFDSDDNLLACLVFKELNARTYQMRQVAVEPQTQGTGVGSFLVETAEQWAISQRKQQIILHARKESIPFYLRLHYETYGEPYTEVGIPHQNMRKDLSIT